MTPNPAEGSVSREHDPKKKRKKEVKIGQLVSQVKKKSQV
jgi:hypothetical protein